MILKRKQTLFENSLLEIQSQSKFFSLINRRITKYNKTSLTLSNGSETKDLDLINKEFNFYFALIYNKCKFIDIDLSINNRDVIVFCRNTINTAIVIFKLWELCWDSS